MSDRYGHYRLPQLWTMVQGDNGDGAAYHLTTWERQITLLSEQSKRLKDLRADLVAKWPPDQSDASFAFISRVTEMINAMDQTVDDSVKVRTGLKQVADALEGARKQLLPLVDQYDDKAAAWKSATERAFPSLPSTLLTGASLVPGADAMVVHLHQQKLDEQAREIMRSADQIVAEAQVPLNTRMAGYRSLSTVGRAQSSTCPRMADRRHAASRGGDTLRAHATFCAPPQFDPPPVPAVPDQCSPGPTRRSIGGVLGPSVARARWPGSADLERVVPGIVGGVGPVANVPSEVMRRIPPGHAVLRPGGVIDSRGPAFEPTSGQSPGFPGVIGGIGGVAPLGHGRQGTGPVERSGPVVIAARPGDRGRRCASRDWYDRAVGGIGSTRNTSSVGKSRSVGDPDNPWTVAEGIPPVVEPPPERRHDVGPGVIGIDR